MLTFASGLLRPISLLSSVAALLTAAGCSSSPTTGASGGEASTTTASSTSGDGTSSATAAAGTGGGSSSSTSSGSSSATAAAGTGGGSTGCAPKGFGGGEKAVVGGSVTATIVDQNGMPVANQPLYICGIDICSPPATTDVNGTATIATNLMMKAPAFKFGDAVAYAELAIPLTAPMTAFMTVGTGKLPAAGAALTPGAVAASGGVTVAVPAGGSVGLDLLIYDTPEKQQLRAVAMPLAQEGAVLAPMALGFEMLYGVAPAETLLCPAAKVTVPNTPAWAAGTLVEFWVMTVDTGQQYAPYAGWALASDGVVSADGATVSTVGGEGFVYLDTFGVRKKP